MLRTQQGTKGEVADALPKAGPSGLYSFQYVGAPPANAWGVPCIRGRSTCSLGCALLLGCATVFLLVEIASRPLPVRHWSGACGQACQHLKTAQALAESCRPPLVNKDFLLAANKVYGDTCYVLPRTCLDQGSVVVFADEFNPTKPDHISVPSFDMRNIMYNFPSSQGNGDALGTDAVRIPFPGITIRPGTYLDTHLSSQQFSRCTVPVVMITNWLTTYGEVIVRIPPRAFAWREAGAVGGNVTFVVATPGGMGLPAFYGPMLAPVTDLDVTSLADFSVRRVLGAPSGATNEGLARQCFDKVVLCKIAGSQFGNMYEVGQATYAHYELEGLPKDPAGFLSPIQDRGSALGVSSFLAEHSPAPRQLRVLIEQRSGDVRNMLQLEELLSRCNQSQPPDSGLDLSCRQFTFTGDLKRNIAAARSANVLVTIHGSGSNNALFMEEESTLIELRPYQFGTKASEWANAFMPKVTEENGYRIRYIGLNVEDETLSEPGSFEARETGNPDEHTHRRDRHVKLRWDLLEQILRLIQSCETLEDYTRLVSQGGHILNVLPGGVLRPWLSHGMVDVPDAGLSPASAGDPSQGLSLPQAILGSQAAGNSSGAGPSSLRDDTAAEKLDHTD
ncbi:g13197 [Coccomyxa viridis]|uniref:G13197 protein n=1 Tax=Coccomyxa viridis TaxID=1274662 RepID=A0ABP1GES5_9CHLO